MFRSLIVPPVYRDYYDQSTYTLQHVQWDKEFLDKVMIQDLFGLSLPWSLEQCLALIFGPQEMPQLQTNSLDLALDKISQNNKDNRACEAISSILDLVDHMALHLLA